MKLMYKILGTAFTKEEMLEDLACLKRATLYPEFAAVLELDSNPIWLQSLHKFICNWFNDQRYIEVQTSGSTGKPKLIRLTKEHMRNSALATGAFFDLKANQNALHCLPVDYIAGKMMLVRSFELGLNLIPVPPSSQPFILENLVIDFAAMIPFQVAQLFEKDPKNFQKIQQLIIGGGIVDHHLNSKIQSLTTRCFSTYGMTETITHIAVQTLSGPEKKTSYHALPNVSFEQDERNCLLIDAPSVSTEKVLTNDIVELKSSTIFNWLGRFDNVINSGGIKVHPEQVEQRLAAHLNQRFFIFGQADPNLGEQVVLIVEGTTWTKEKLSTFIQKLQEILPKFWKPKSILFSKKFAETPTGKVQRSQTISALELLD